MNDEIAPEIAALLENTEEIEPITSFSAPTIKLPTKPAFVPEVLKA